MNFNISGKHALITGASQGIGLEIASLLAGEGVRCTLVARRKDILEAEVKTLSGKGHNIYSCDLQNTSEIQNLIRSLENDMPDIIIHNVGGTLGVKSALSDYDDWMNVIKFNFGISVIINNAIVPKLKDKGWGRIVHISSISGQSLRGSAPYGASKALLSAYSKVLAREVAPYNIVVSAVSPGAIYADGGHWDEQSPHNQKDIDAFHKKRSDFLRHHHAIERLGLANEIAPWVVMLCSEQASFCVGTDIEIDGGTM
ncbi:MAG: SDR family NAD(P)-dependent oxidoreductase [Amylibacter sp.]|jgi:3-oxoacyl-[acyl-carrier protein] reductase